ncbi:hypothetical protein DFS34DRAFT_428269 [Phlyctochytrium arcticum]|nr:hypothetical protein DFS34DRAFT_428269 [Phlyctochytrium arcticum]
MCPGLRKQENRCLVHSSPRALTGTVALVAALQSRVSFQTQRRPARPPSFIFTGVFSFLVAHLISLRAQTSEMDLSCHLGRLISYLSWICTSSQLWPADEQTSDERHNAQISSLGYALGQLMGNVDLSDIHVIMGIEQRKVDGCEQHLGSKVPCNMRNSFSCAK